MAPQTSLYRDPVRMASISDPVAGATERRCIARDFAGVAGAGSSTSIKFWRQPSPLWTLVEGKDHRSRCFWRSGRWARFTRLMRKLHLTTSKVLAVPRPDHVQC